MNAKIKIYLLGLIFLSLGISITIKSNIGTSVWDSINLSLTDYFGFTPGFWNFIVGIILVVGISIYNKTKLRISVIIVGLIVGIFINIWLIILRYPSANPQYILGIVGISLMSLGISMYSELGLPLTPIDDFMISIKNINNIAISKAKLITDSIGMVAVILLGGRLGIGTVLMYILIPLQLKYIKSISSRKNKCDM